MKKYSINLSFRLIISIFIVMFFCHIKSYAAIWLYDGYGNFKVYISNAIKRGWFKENGNQYYATKEGNLALGWVEIDGDMYFFNTGYSDFGKRVTGYHYIDGYRYYFDSDGKLLRDDYISGYRADEDGIIFDENGNEMTGNELSSKPTENTIMKIAEERNKLAGEILEDFNKKNETTKENKIETQAIVKDISSIVGAADSGVIRSKRRATDDQLIKVNANQSKIFIKDSGNLSLKNNYDYTNLKIDSEKTKQVEEVVKQFVNNYIKSDMTDFEKEMQIIQYLVENNVYDYQNYLENKIPVDSYTSYGALVKKTSVCAGYADAFNVLCKAVNIESEIVSGKGNGGSHAWNRIKLDNNWYNVDVTWEDPVPSNNYGFGNLRNKYINLTDEELKFDHEWVVDKVCNSTLYGKNLIEYYMLKGKVDKDFNIDSFRNELMMEFEPSIKKVESNSYTLEYTNNPVYSIGAKFTNGLNYLTTNDEQVVKDVIVDMIDKNYKTIYLTYNKDTDMNFINNNWLTKNTKYNNWWVVDMGENTYSSYNTNKSFKTLWLIPEFTKFAK